MKHPKAMKHPKTDLEILGGWKEIATHLGRGVRTVQRYERELGLPVHRAAGKNKGSVIATKGEIDAWVLARPIRQAFRLPQAPVAIAPLSEFRMHMQQTYRLGEEMKELGAAVWASLGLLQENLRLALPQAETREGRAVRRRVAELLPFDPHKNVI